MAKNNTSENKQLFLYFKRSTNRTTSTFIAVKTINENVKHSTPFQCRLLKNLLQPTITHAQLVA